MDYLHTTEAELGINLDITLSEQDPLDKLNDLANKKRKHADDIHDYFKANKRLKSSVQYEDHVPGTVLNKLVPDNKNTFEDSWKDSSEDEREETCPMAAGSLKAHRNHLPQVDSWNVNITNNEVAVK
ncbi:hypothetical protein Tco_0425244 [Tanacetum coccineum]